MHGIYCSTIPLIAVLMMTLFPVSCPAAEERETTQLAIAGVDEVSVHAELVGGETQYVRFPLVVTVRVTNTSEEDRRLASVSETSKALTYHVTELDESGNERGPTWTGNRETWFQRDGGDYHIVLSYESLGPGETRESAAMLTNTIPGLPTLAVGTYQLLVEYTLRPGRTVEAEPVVFTVKTAPRELEADQVQAGIQSIKEGKPTLATTVVAYLTEKGGEGDVDALLTLLDEAQDGMLLYIIGALELVGGQKVEHTLDQIRHDRQRADGVRVAASLALKRLEERAEQKNEPEDQSLTEPNVQ